MGRQISSALLYYKDKKKMLVLSPFTIFFNYKNDKV